MRGWVPVINLLRQNGTHFVRVGLETIVRNRRAPPGRADHQRDLDDALLADRYADPAGRVEGTAGRVRRWGEKYASGRSANSVDGAIPSGPAWRYSMGKGGPMVEETLQHIESRLRERGTMTDEQRAELLALVGKLRLELDELEQTDPEQAQQVANLTERTARYATREPPDGQLVEQSSRNLQRVAYELEASHPRLARVADAILRMLADIGL